MMMMMMIIIIIIIIIISNIGHCTHTSESANVEIQLHYISTLTPLTQELAIYAP